MYENEKPLWDEYEYDNIFEIKRSGYPPTELVEEVLRKRPKPYPVLKLGRGTIYTDAAHFIYSVAHKPISLPLFKIVIPRLKTPNVGAIYYVAESEGKSFVFRSTYGYGGRGPHESALIETCFERLCLIFEVRDGDYLLNFFLRW
jgi:hypothetical protein